MRKREAKEKGNVELGQTDSGSREAVGATGLKAGGWKEVTGSRLKGEPTEKERSLKWMPRERSSCKPKGRGGKD